MRFLVLALLLSSPLSSWAADTILVGQFSAKIIPKQFQTITLPEKSIISELATEERLSKGALIAKVNYEDILDEKDELELAILRERLTALDEISDLKEQKRKLEFYLSLSKQEQQYEQNLYASTIPPSQETIKDLEERIDLIEKEQEFSELKKRKLYDKKEKKAHVLMPFDGRVQYHFTLPHDPSVAFECDPVAQFATLCDDSTLYICLSIADASLTQLPADKFYARIPLPAGKELLSRYEFRRVEGQQGGDMLVYYFAIPDQDKDRAFTMIGTHAKAELYYQAADQSQRISKAALALDPNASSSENWHDLIKLSHPGYHILLEAEKEIIIIPEGVEP